LSESENFAKHPSDSRWSARADDTEVIFRGYKQFQSALQETANDHKKTGNTRNEAKALAKQMDAVAIGKARAVCAQSLAL